MAQSVDPERPEPAMALLSAGVPLSLIIDLSGCLPLDSVAYLVDEGGSAAWLA